MKILRVPYTYIRTILDTYHMLVLMKLNNTELSVNEIMRDWHGPRYDFEFGRGRE